MGKFSKVVRDCTNPRCGGIFFPKVPWQRYCCDKCKTTHGNKLYRDAHPQWASEQHALSYQRHKNLRKIWAVGYRAKRREAIRKFHKRWRDSNPDRMRLYAIQSRMRKCRSVIVRQSAPLAERLTTKEWEALLTAWNHKCAYCSQQPDKLTQDHVIPISKGGTHTMDNIVPACLTCNMRKGNRVVGEFLFDAEL